MKYFESKTVVVQFEEALNAVSIQWKSQSSSRTLRSAFNRSYEILLRNQATNLVIDTRHLSRLSTIDQQWIAKVMPHAKAQGLSKVAILLPKNELLKYPLESLKTALQKQHLLAEIFEDKVELEAWVQSAVLPL